MKRSEAKRRNKIKKKLNKIKNKERGGGGGGVSNKSSQDLKL